MGSWKSEHRKRASEMKRQEWLAGLSVGSNVLVWESGEECHEGKVVSMGVDGIRVVLPGLDKVFSLETGTAGGTQRLYPLPGNARQR